MGVRRSIEMDTVHELRTLLAEYDCSDWPDEFYLVIAKFHLDKQKALRGVCEQLVEVQRAILPDYKLCVEQMVKMSKESGIDPQPHQGIAELWIIKAQQALASANTVLSTEK